MGSKPETTFTNGIHRHLPPKPELHREKMNNPYSSGTADVWYSGTKADMWVEYKFLPRTPQRAQVSPHKLLSALQLEWLEGRHAEGRNVYVIIGCPDGGVVLCAPELRQDIPAETFRKRLQSRAQLAEWILTQVR